MVRGRKPKPSRQRALEGNPGGRRFNEYEPQPKAVEPEKPGDLTEREEAIWDVTAEDLRAMGLFRRADAATVRGFVRSLALALEADQAVHAEGRVVQSPHGAKRNPELGIANEAWVAVRSFASELGLSPASRTRVQTSGGAGEGGTLMAMVAQAIAMRGR